MRQVKNLKIDEIAENTRWKGVDLIVAQVEFHNKISRAKKADGNCSQKVVREVCFEKLVGSLEKLFWYDMERRVLEDNLIGIS